LAQVLAPVQGQHRAAPQYRRERRVGLAGAEVGLVAAEHLADRLRVGDVDADAEDEQRHRDQVAVATVPGQQRLQRPLHQAGGVDNRRRARTGRQPGDYLGALDGLILDRHARQFTTTT
jgi:hypothetical protein